MYPMGSVSTVQHPVTPSDMNQTQLTDPYSSPFINRPSLFSSSHHQHQAYSTVVNPEQSISNPSMRWSTMGPQSFPMQQSGFSPLTVPVNGVPWKCPEWMANQTIQPGSYMSFNGQQQVRLPFKRKAEPNIDESIYSKQLITEEKMAAHLNGMHISSEFKAHDINRSAGDVNVSSDSVPLPYPNSIQDIEEKLKRAHKITVSDVVKSIQEEPLLPAAIMQRYEKPCKALVIWQPPKRITDLIVSKSVRDEQTDDDENNDNNNDNNNENNNVDFMDASNDMEMELDS